MLTAEKFRDIVLRMDGARESAHMGHPDFRANGRIFATLYPGGESGMVKLTPEQQQEFMRKDSVAFVPASGAWGRQGCTTVKLAALDEDTLGEAVTLAWQNTRKPGAAKRKKQK
ncbi:MAG: MmcQ/YjbR family DNA-binding protein [Pyrinomonadaceae bacterium]